MARYDNFDPNLPPEIQAEMRKAQRRERLAELMAQQSMQPLQGQMVGNHYVGASPMQGIAQLAQAYSARKMDDRAGEEYEGAVKSHQDMKAQAIQDYIKKSQMTVPMDDGGNPLPPYITPTVEDKRKHIYEAMANPYTQDIAALDYQRLEKEKDRTMQQDFQAEQKEMDRELRKEMLQQRIEDQRLSREEREASRRELAAMNQQLRVDLQYNQQSFMAEQKAADRAASMERTMAGIKSRQEEKMKEASGKSDEAKQRVSGNLEALSSIYDELDKLGAMVNVEKGSLDNISARIRSSNIGQMAGGLIGSQEQSYRNQVNQMRPLLIQEIRQATAMGARGLDSNRELDFYLQAATDPQRDFQSNKAAIQVLENAYGLSSKVSGVDEAAVNELKKEWESKQGEGADSGDEPPKILKFDAQGNPL